MDGIAREEGAVVRGSFAGRHLGIEPRFQDGLTGRRDRPGGAFAQTEREISGKFQQRLVRFRDGMMSRGEVQQPVGIDKPKGDRAVEGGRQPGGDAAETRVEIEIGVAEGARGLIEQDQSARGGVGLGPAPSFVFEQPEPLDRLAGVLRDQQQEAALIVARLARLLAGDREHPDRSALRPEREARHAVSPREIHRVLELRVVSRHRLL